MATQGHLPRRYPEGPRTHTPGPLGVAGMSLWHRPRLCSSSQSLRKCAAWPMRIDETEIIMVTEMTHSNQRGCS